MKNAINIPVPTIIKPEIALFQNAFLRPVCRDIILAIII